VPTDFTVLSNGITQKLNGMVNRVNGIQAYLNRVVYAQYQKAQIARWQSENKTEGEIWERLDSKYASYKLKACAKYPYSGTKMLIFKGTLFQSVVGKGGGGSKYHRKVTDKRSITIGTALPYATYVNKARPFWEFGEKTIDEIKQGIMDFVARNKQ
jgi:hypothetical protein